MIVIVIYYRCKTHVRAGNYCSDNCRITYYRICTSDSQSKVHTHQGLIRIPFLLQHMVIGGLPLVVISFLNHDPALNGSFMELTSNDLLALLYTSLFGSAISYGVYFYNATRGRFLVFYCSDFCIMLLCVTQDTSSSAFYYVQLRFLELVRSIWQCNVALHIFLFSGFPYSFILIY